MSAPIGLLRLAALTIPRRRFAVNHARTFTGIVTGQGAKLSIAAIARSTAAGRARAGAWAAPSGGVMEAVASAGRLHGRRSWQVTQLLAGECAEGAVTRVLEWVSAEAARAGAERVFLRLPADCILLDAARRSGYFPAYYETLMRSQPPELAPVPAGPRATDPREASRPDEYGVFRLYNAAVPPVVRRLAGVTFDQWRDSRERGPGRGREYVLEGDRALEGWLRVGRKGANGWMQGTLAPASMDAALTLAAFALEQLAGARSVCSLVPEYQPDLRRALGELGMAPGAEYVVCIRTMASTVRLAAGAEARA